MSKRKIMVTVIQGNGTPMIAKKISRNSPCLCRSGLKSKNCCGVKTDYYHSGKEQFSKRAKKRAHPELLDIIDKKEAQLKRIREEAAKNIATNPGL